jgi:hypothetical protein
MNNQSLPLLSNINSMVACTNSQGSPDWFSLQNMQVWSNPNQTSKNLWTFKQPNDSTLPGWNNDLTYFD